MSTTDLSDLIARLRTDVLWHERRGNETIAKDCAEAADELERLRAQVDEALEAGRQMVEMAVAQTREHMAPDGWKLVPVEPTPEMVAAGGAFLCNHTTEFLASLDEQAESCWRDMLAAAPAQQAEPTIQQLAAGAHYPQVYGWTNPAPHAEPALAATPSITVQIGGAPSLTVGDEPVGQPLSRFDAVERAMDLASLMGGSIGRNDRDSTNHYRAQLREHLIAYIPAAPQPAAQGVGATVDLRQIAERAGISMDLWDMGAASLAYSKGCNGITRQHLEQFAARYGFACWNAALEANPPNMQGFVSRAIGSLFEKPAKPLSVTEIGSIGIAAQIAYNLDKFDSYEEAIARGIEAAHGIGA